MTHGYASWVFVNLYGDFIPSHSKAKIGNNIWFGENVTVLKEVTIGDNCIIGFGSIVTKDIPANSVAVGSPAKIICTIDEYYDKRKVTYRTEVMDYAKSIIESFDRSPQLSDFQDDYPAFVDGSNINEYQKMPYHNVFKNKSA